MGHPSNRLQQNAVQGTNSFSATFSATTNQITTSGYGYDAAGNMTNDGFHAYTYDAEGNILTVDSSGVQYIYDALNRRIRAQSSASTYEYLYDYAGRRTSSWLNPSSGNPGTGNEGRIYWDGQQIAYRAWDGTTYFDQQNYLGTESLRTNDAGAVVSTYPLLPWGDGSSATYSGTGANQDNAAFAGLDADINSAGAPMSDHAQFRNYSFYQGRWMSPDPYDGSYDFTNPQSLNRYAYAGNNPLSFTDPSGQECVWDDGSFDSDDDPVTGTADGCAGQGGYYVPPDMFESVEGNAPGSWSGQGNSNIAFDWTTPSAVVNSPDIWQNSAYSFSAFASLLTLYVPIEGIPVPVVSLGISPTVTVIPKTKTACVGLSVGLASGTGKSFSATMYPSNSAGFSKAVSSEWGWTLNAQPSPLIGVSFNTNSSGTLIGVTTATDPGGSATYGYNWCADF